MSFLASLRHIFGINNVDSAFADADHKSHSNDDLFSDDMFELPEYAYAAGNVHNQDSFTSPLHSDSPANIHHTNSIDTDSHLTFDINNANSAVADREDASDVGTYHNSHSNKNDLYADDMFELPEYAYVAGNVYNQDRFTSPMHSESPVNIHHTNSIDTDTHLTGCNTFALSDDSCSTSISHASSMDDSFGCSMSHTSSFDDSFGCCSHSSFDDSFGCSSSISAFDDDSSMSISSFDDSISMSSFSSDF